MEGTWCCSKHRAFLISLPLCQRLHASECVTGSDCVGQLLSAFKPPQSTPGVVSQEEVAPPRQEAGHSLDFSRPGSHQSKDFAAQVFPPELARELTLPGCGGWDPGALALCKHKLS